MSNDFARRLLGAALASVAALPAVAQKMPDTRLDAGPPGETSSYNQLIAASGPYVYVVWQELTGMHFNRSLDGGATWLPTARNLGLGAVTDLVATGLTVHLTWSYFNDVYLDRSLDGGTTWLPVPVRVNRTPGTAMAINEGARMVVSGTGVYVTWVRDSFFQPNPHIYFNRSLDGGITWLPQDVQLDSSPTGRAQQPEISVSGACVHVTWEDLRNSVSVFQLREDIYFNRSLDGGVTWLASDLRLNTNPAGQTRSHSPRIAAAGAAVYVAWDDQPGAYFNRSLDCGSTWLANHVKISGGDNPEIVASGTAVYATWASSSADIYFGHSLDQGTTWVSPVRVSTDPPGVGAAFVPRIALSGSAVSVTWTDHRHVVGDVFFNRSLDGGVTWLASDLRLNTSPIGGRSARDPVIAADGPAVHVAWTDHRNGSDTDIYYNIPFGFQPYGKATAGSGGFAPRLASTGSATIGSTASVDVADGLGGAAGSVFIGVGPSSKTSTSILGGTLLVLPAVAIPLSLGGASGVPGAGIGSLPLPIPPDPAAVGANLNFQAVFLDAGAPAGVSMTNGVEMWIG